MSKKEKLIKRLLSRPSAFTVTEMDTLLGYFGYYRRNEGRTSGSRIKYDHPKLPPIKMHKPHPTNIVNRNYLNDIIKRLREEGLL